MSTFDEGLTQISPLGDVWHTSMALLSEECAGKVNTSTFVKAYRKSRGMGLPGKAAPVVKHSVMHWNPISRSHLGHASF